MNLLSIALSVSYRNKPAALNDLRFEIARGEIFALVGESGSGKSTAALAILRLLDPRVVSITGSVIFEGRDLMRCRERELRRIRGCGIALAPQSPVAAFNPALRFEAHFREAWKAHSALPWRDARHHVIDLLRRMDLPDAGGFLERYPSQVSVGQAQRVLMALAVLHQPRLLIADEPTSALDPGAHQGILDLLARLNRDLGMGILYISHDMPSVAKLCHRVGVLRGGRLAECGSAREVLSA